MKNKYRDGTRRRDGKFYSSSKFATFVCFVDKRFKTNQGRKIVKSSILICQSNILKYIYTHEIVYSPAFFFNYDVTC